MTAPTITFSAFVSTLRLLGTAPKWFDQFRKWRGRPGQEDSKLVVAYCRRVDERRVFSAPYNVEVELSVIYSLDQVKQWTEEALSNANHPAVRAALGAIVDELRGFLDTWRGHQGHHRNFNDGWRPGHGDEHQSEFFKDLGELRGKMKVLVGMLIELVPSAKAPQLLGTGS